MPGKESPTADWFIMCVITGLLVFVTLEAGVFALLGATGWAPSLASGVRALSIIAGVTGTSAVASFLYARALR